MLYNTSNQPSKVRKKIWGKINDDSREKYNINSQIKFKTRMLKSSLYDYSDIDILSKETITVAEARATSAPVNADGNNKQAILKYCVPFTECITDINNTHE